jgi:SAM-dependent methyltransferase
VTFILAPDQIRRLRQRRRRLMRPAWLGTIRSTGPISDEWGRDRGQEIDRVYIERFLGLHSQDIRGHVLEVKDRGYTDQFGSGVDTSDVLDIDASNGEATLVADLARAEQIRSDQFDCFILTQTLQFVDDLETALAHVQRILRPGGVLLATMPGISRVERAYVSTDYWRFTEASCRLLISRSFGAGRFEVTSYGNVLSAMAFLTGLAREDLSEDELETRDVHFPVIVAVRAVKGMSPASEHV